MSDNAEIVFAGNAKGLLDEYKKLEKANEQLSQKLAASMKVSKQAANEEKKLRQEVTQAIEKSKTPAEAYIATINRYKQALQAGMITAEQFNRIRDKELTKLNATKAATDKLTDAEKKNAAAKTQVAAAGKLTDDSNTLMSSGFRAAAVVIGAATLALKAFADEQQRIQEKTAGTAVSIDQMAREYAIQAGLSEEEVIPAQNKILAIARMNAVTPDKAFPAAQQLSSVGFDDPVNSGALDTFMKIQATSNLRGGDPKQLASSMAQFLNAYELPVNKGTMTDLGVRMRGLMSKMVEVSELENFAKAAPVLATAKIPMDEGLAYMAQLRDKFQAPEAATGIKNVVSILRGASEDTSNKKALAQIGLTPEDVDMVGETMTVALQRLDAALQKAPEEKRAGIRTKLFGRENEAASSAILSGLPKVQEYIDAQGDTKGFLAGVERAGRGPAATKTRTDIANVQAELQRQELATLRDMLSKESEAAYIRRQSAIENDPTRSTLGKTAAMWGDWFSTKVASKPAQWIAYPEDRISAPLLEEYKRRNMQSPEFTEQDLRARMGNAAADPQAPAMAEQTKVLKEISNKLTPPAKPTENPNLQGRPR